MSDSFDSSTVSRTEINRLTERLERARAAQIGPLATLASELLHELEAPSPDWGRAFLLQIDLFEVAVALLSFINICELANGSRNAEAARDPLTKLRDGSKLSTGHWWALLRATSQVLHAGPHPASEAPRIASSLYGNQNRQGNVDSPITARLDAVPNLRNRVKGHAWTLPAEQYAEHALSLLGTTTALFAALEGLTRCTLLRVTRCTTHPSGHIDVDAQILRGDPRRPPRLHLRCRSSLVPECLYVADAASLDVEFVEAQSLLNLHPFVQWRRTPEGHEGVFIAQGLEKGGLDLASVLGGARLTCKSSLAAAQTRLDGLLPKASPTESGFDRLRSRTTELAREVLSASGSRASYDPRHYLVRPRIAQHLDDARRVAAPTANPASGEASQRTLALISGPSGSGKTALCCHATERWLLAGPADRLVVVVRWSELLAAGEDVQVWWTQRFGQSLAESCAHATGAKATISLYLDSIDRLPDIDRVTSQLLDLVHKPDYTALRVSVTATDGVAGRIARAFASRGANSARALHRWSVPNLSADEARRLYELLGESETGRTVRAPESILRYLQSPLLVRLARSLDSGDTHGAITPGRLLRAHADRTVLSDPIRAHLAMGLVRHILETESKSVALDKLLADPELRPSLLANHENAPLQTLVREQVLMIDRVQSTSLLPMPAETRLAFTFDAQLDYLVFLALNERSLQDLEALGALHRDSAPFGPLVGGLRVLVVESLHTCAHTDTQLVSLFRNLSAPLRVALLAEVLGVGLHESHARRAIEQIARQAFDTEPGALSDAAARAFERLVVGGLLDEAFDIAALVATHAPCPESRALLCRAIRMDAWSRDAERAARRARELLASSPSQSLEEHVCALDAHSFALEQLGQRNERHAVDEALRGLGGHAPFGSAEARVALALATARLHDDAHAFNLRDAEHERALALVGTERELVCRTKLTIADILANRHEPGNAERTRRLADDALVLARELGDAALEAHACEVVAHAAPSKGDAAMLWIEEGLLAAGASRCRGATSRLLQRRARIHLGQGRYEEARADARSAEAEARLAHHHAAALRMRVHVQLTACWELGQPGAFEKLVHEIRDDANQQGAPFEEALGHLLDARVACRLGDTERAAQSLDVVDAMRIAHPEARKVHPALLRGECEWLAGNHEKAFASWTEAAKYGDESKFADFIYQPRLAEARARLTRARVNVHELPAGDAALKNGLKAEIDGERGLVLTSLQTLLATAPHHVGQVARYEGEISMLLAWALWDLGRHTEAEVWEQRAQEWFTAHPLSLHAPEHHALVLQRDWERSRTTPETASTIGNQRIADQRLVGKARKHVCTPVEEQAASFATESERDALIRNHPAMAHLHTLQVRSCVDLGASLRASQHDRTVPMTPTSMT